MTQPVLPALNDSAFSSMALTFRVMRLAAVWRTRLERALRPHGMTVAVMRPLAYLMMMPEGATQRDLALVRTRTVPHWCVCWTCWRRKG